MRRSARALRSRCATGRYRGRASRSERAESGGLQPGAPRLCRRGAALMATKERAGNQGVTVNALLAATATQWVGGARMARGLADAGFTVSLLTPRGALAEHSRFVSRIGYLDDNASPHDWAFAFAAMVKAAAPRIVLPCDEVSLRLMQALVLAPHEGMHATMQIQL